MRKKGRGTRQGRTIELRLEGRWLCLWGLLAGEVSPKEGELSLLPLSDPGSQLSDPLVVVLGHPPSLCPVPVLLTFRRAGCQDLQPGDGGDESPVNGAGGGEGHRRAADTGEDQQTRGTDRHTREKTDGARPRQPLCISRTHPQPPRAGAPLQARLGTALTTA